MTHPVREGDADAPGPRIDRLVCRLAAAMGIFAAAVFLACLAAVTRLPRVTAGYAIPGTTHILDAGVVPLLAACGGVAALFGCAAFWLGRGSLRLGSRTGLPKGRSRRRPVTVLLAGAAALAVVVLLKR